MSLPDLARAAPWPSLDGRLCQLVGPLVKVSCQKQATWILLHFPTAPRPLPLRNLAFLLLNSRLDLASSPRPPHSAPLLPAVTLQQPLGGLVLLASSLWLGSRQIMCSDVQDPRAAPLLRGDRTCGRQAGRLCKPYQESVASPSSLAFSFFFCSF